jgi:hypothetical protein
MIDIANEIDAISREVSKRQGPDGEEIAVLIRRSYYAPSTEVWDAWTDPRAHEALVLPSQRRSAGGRDIPARRQRRR